MINNEVYKNKSNKNTTNYISIYLSMYLSIYIDIVVRPVKILAGQEQMITGPVIFFSNMNQL